MTFFITYKDGRSYYANDFGRISLNDFGVRDMACLSYGGCMVRFGQGEKTIAHRIRRRLVVGDTQTRDHYCLLTNQRSVYIFPDGKFVVMHDGGQDDVLFRRLALQFDESQYMMHASEPESEVIEKNT